MHFLLTCRSRRWKLLLPSWPRPRKLLPSPGSLREETWLSSSSPGRTNWNRENKERESGYQTEDVEVINTQCWLVIWAGVVTWRSPRGRTAPYEYSHWQSWRGTASGIKFSYDTDWSSAPEEWSDKHKLLNPHSEWQVDWRNENSRKDRTYRDEFPTRTRVVPRVKRPLTKEAQQKEGIL